MQTAATQLSEKISEYDYSKIVAHAIKENPEIATSSLTALNEYKMYIHLFAFVSETLEAPELVDKIFHSHVLHTREFGDFCGSIGYFVHHKPNDEDTSDEEKQSMRQNLINASIRIFGKNVFTLSEKIDSGGSSGFSR